MNGFEVIKSYKLRS